MQLFDFHFLDRFLRSRGELWVSPRKIRTKTRVWFWKKKDRNGWKSTNSFFVKWLILRFFLLADFLDSLLLRDCIVDILLKLCQSSTSSRHIWRISSIKKLFDMAIFAMAPLQHNVNRTCRRNREVWNSSIGFNLSFEIHKRKKSQKRTKLKR